MSLKVTWLDGGREPRERPNPNFPKGIDLDISIPGRPWCYTDLPYPAPRCGAYVVRCERCGLKAGITTAGRPDDPRSVKLACKMMVH